MATTGLISRFRITTDQTDLLAPRLPRFEIDQVEDETGSLWLSSSRTWRTVELTPEFFLRDLRGFDPDDDAALLQFVTAAGIPWIDPSRREGVPHFLFPRAVLAEVRQQGRNHCTLESVRWMTRALRAVAGHWIAASEAADIPSAWVSEGFKERSEAAAWQIWIPVVNSLLEPFAPRLVLLDEHDDEGFGEFGLVEIGLESAVVLQIFEAIEGQLPLKRCACAGCDQVFFQQDPGQPRRKQRLTGVVYCSHKCANRQANRNRRARLRSSRSSS